MDKNNITTMDKKQIILSQQRARYHIRKGRDPPPDPTPEEKEARRIAKEENPFIDPPRLDGESEADYKTRVKSYRASISNKRSRRVSKILKDRVLARADNMQAIGAMENNTRPLVSWRSAAIQVGRLVFLPAASCPSLAFDFIFSSYFHYL